MAIMLMRSICIGQLGSLLQRRKLVELNERLNYMWLDSLGRGYVGSRNGTSRLVVQPEMKLFGLSRNLVAVSCKLAFT